MRDIVVVGAGICGVSIAWTLKKKGLNVTIIDKSQAIPTGGSMAAGAFISPKIGKGSPLQKLTNEAFDFSWRFYKRYFSKFFHQSGVLRLPKSWEDAKKFKIYEKYNYPNYRQYSREFFSQNGLNLDYDIGFFFPDAGDCDGIKLIQEMVRGIEFLQIDIKRLQYLDESWLLSGDGGEIEAKRVILATGYQNSLLNIDMDYMGVKPLWGSRGDYKLNSGGFEFSTHQDFSLSSQRDGIVKVGATHIKSKKPCLVCDGKPLKELETKVKKLAPSIDIELSKLYCGYRSGSRDFFPLVGDIVDVEATYQANPKIIKGAKISPIYHKNLYIINGVGGRGYVFAPFLANILSNYLILNRNIPSQIHPNRLFTRWIRREGRERFQRGQR